MIDRYTGTSNDGQEEGKNRNKPMPIKTTTVRPPLPYEIIYTNHYTDFLKALKYISLNGKGSSGVV